jgi:MFS family permease
LAAFLWLWLWPGWHYRFRWLLLAYLGLIAGFVSVLLASNLLWIISAQIIFGLAIGLIYYSSLFYSMDFSETKGEHGGIHEAVIGIGNFTGPAVGVLALQLMPQVPHSAALAVTLCLFGGLAGLLGMWQRARKN